MWGFFFFFAYSPESYQGQSVHSRIYCPFIFNKLPSIFKNLNVTRTETVIDMSKQPEIRQHTHDSSEQQVQSRFLSKISAQIARIDSSNG